MTSKNHPLPRLIADERRVARGRFSGLTTIAMLAISTMLWPVSAALAAGPAPLAPSPQVATATFDVAPREVDDLKAVFATVRSKDRIEARVRTPGTVVTLKVEEGAHVTAGQVLANIADPKIALKIRSLDAQVLGIQSRLDTAKLDYDRAIQLLQRGVTPQSRVDQLKSAYDVAANELKSARAERLVADEQVKEGEVLAPADGRVLKVPVTEGSVVMGGESIATIAANQYVLRLELPERHARFMKKGDTIKVGARGLSPDQQVLSEGHITQVYPELQGGRVLADAEVSTIGDYFVGERALAWISAGKRRTVVIPAAFVVERFGLDFVRLMRGTATLDVVVQPGERMPTADLPDGIEILSGLQAGDKLMAPQVQQ